ncbi:MAG: hypothetical protein KDD78_10360 [Caldilineaceae bacterium]|nr:hypothetical protein [Caldilineaceae bacterium]
MQPLNSGYTNMIADQKMEVGDRVFIVIVSSSSRQGQSFAPPQLTDGKAEDPNAADGPYLNEPSVIAGATCASNDAVENKTMTGKKDRIS